MRVALITPGSIADAAWNSGAYDGLRRIHDSLGIEISHVEAMTPGAQEEALRSYAAQGYDLIFGHGYEFQAPSERVAKEYPGPAYVITSGARAEGRVIPLIFRLEEASYLAGMAAGGLTRSGIIGFVGGVELPPVRTAYQGWVNGARATRPDVETRITYLNNWDDAAAGKEAALALIRLGADAFHHNADAAALGVFQAVKERSATYIFGANSDQTALAPGSVVGSAVIDLPRAFLLVARELQAGTLEPRVHAFGLASGVVRYVPNPALDTLLPPVIRARMAAASDSIAAGTLVPAARPPEMQAHR
jgi:basic membrane lipoprotein Med (substrate-binding protein (PBP1-ABC) superfamily)